MEDNKLNYNINKLINENLSKLKIKLYPDVGDSKEMEILVDTSKDIDNQIVDYIDKNEKYISEYEILNFKDLKAVEENESEEEEEM